MFKKWFRKAAVAIPREPKVGAPTHCFDPERRPSWDLIEMRNKQGAIIGTMLLHRGIAYPDASKPQRAYVTFKYRGHLLPTEEEREWIGEMEEVLFQIEEECGAQLVCIWTSKGVRDLIFYLSSAEPFVSRVQVELAIWKPEVSIEPDRGWSQYSEFLAMTY